MGFGCNACGVTGCRIIDSPRERLIAILTNTFVPCNGRFPQPHKEQPTRYEAGKDRRLQREQAMRALPVICGAYRLPNDAVLFPAK